ncbi:MAG TPA: hypothetical protein VL175_05325 [Pirellulales bacterium]|jgi:hypothetical protein|nr:hypothetical protein [Pirellulales bacterium]
MSKPTPADKVTNPAATPFRMSLADRTARSLFVALAVGLGWGIRGDFGHLVGAMYPGAALGLALAYVSGQRSLFLWMPILGALGGLGIGSGGAMSYGILHGYAQADTLINYAYGFVTLFLQGAAWGVFGGALIGLVLERTPLRTIEWLSLIGTTLASGWFISYLVVTVAGFDINPPRNNGSIAHMGAMLGTIVWLVMHGKPTGLRGALAGAIGFGLGMSVGRLLGNTANMLQDQGFTINHWNVMETSCGFIGGFVYCFAMVNRAYPEPPANENIRLPAILGAIYTLGVIPLWHRLGRINPTAKVEEWSTQLKNFGYEDPTALADRVLRLIDALCVLGFVGAIVWLVIYFQRRQKWAALPVLWLSATMLLFQNLNALYFFYPRRENYVNMHHVFWVLFALMVVYAAIARPKPATEPEPAVARPSLVALGWVASAAVVLALAIYVAGFVNGPRTMTSANTRWPRWAWTEGPFPREAQP